MYHWYHLYFTDKNGELFPLCIGISTSVDKKDKLKYIGDNFPWCWGMKQSECRRGWNEIHIICFPSSVVIMLRLNWNVAPYCSRNMEKYTKYFKENFLNGCTSRNRSSKEALRMSCFHFRTKQKDRWINRCHMIQNLALDGSCVNIKLKCIMVSSGKFAVFVYCSGSQALTRELGAT